MIVQHLPQFCSEAVTVKQILKAYCASGNFVLISRPDATSRGADFVRPPGCFPSAIKCAVARQYERACFTYAEPSLYFDFGLLKHLDFI